MRISFNLLPKPWQEMTTIAAACEREGLHSIALADSPLIARELYISCAACLQATRSLRVMTAVTNPLTRHPSVTASAMMSLSEMAPGRVALGIATGDSAAWGVGLKPAKIAELRAYIVALQSLLREETAAWNGHTFRSYWDGRQRDSAVPVYVACSGPKVLRMAVDAADGIIPAMGYAPENIAHVKNLVEDACREVGRDPATFDVWWYADVTFAPSADDAMAQDLGSDSQWLVVGSTDGKLIPAEYIPLLEEMHRDGHDLQTSYKNPQRSRTLVERAKQLGLFDWLHNRAARLWGTPEDVGRRLAELDALGLSQWCLWQDGGDGEAADVPAMLGAAMRAMDQR